eukprot:scaffold277994_cov14-Prasinocladus_malaysianus.AAC.1
MASWAIFWDCRCRRMPNPFIAATGNNQLTRKPYGPSRPPEASKRLIKGRTRTSSRSDMYSTLTRTSTAGLEGPL